MISCSSLFLHNHTILLTYILYNIKWGHIYLHQTNKYDCRSREDQEQAIVIYHGHTQACLIKGQCKLKVPISLFSWVSSGLKMRLYSGDSIILTHDDYITWRICIYMYVCSCIYIYTKLNNIWVKYVTLFFCFKFSGMKGIVNPEILSSFIHTHVIPNS